MHSRISVYINTKIQGLLRANLHFHSGCASKTIHPQWMWKMKAGVFITFNGSIRFTSFQNVGNWNGECRDWVNKFSPYRRMSENIRKDKETSTSSVVGKTFASTTMLKEIGTCSWSWTLLQWIYTIRTCILKFRDNVTDIVAHCTHTHIMLLWYTCPKVSALE